MKSSDSFSGDPGAALSPAARGAGVVLMILSICSVSYALVQSMVNPALEALRDQVHTDQLGVSWVLTAFLLSSAVMTPILGRLGDQIGKRRVLVAVLLLLALGSVVAALATDLPVLVVGRVLQGAGGATLPLAFSIVRDLLPREQVGAKIGMIAAISAVGGAIGLVVTGPIIDGLGVPWLFWLPAIANGIMMLLVLAVVPETGTRSAGRMNWPAGAMLSLTLVLLLLPLSLGQEWGWASGKTLGLFAAAVVAGVLWVLVESRSRFPLIDMTVFRMRAVWTANLASFLFGVTLYSALGFIPVFLQTPSSTGYGLGESVTVSGLLFLPVMASQFVGGLAAGPLGNKMPAKLLLIVGTLPTIIGFLMLGLLHGSAWLVSLSAAIGGLGFGIGLSALSAAVVHAVPAEHTGAATGMNANIRTIGGAVGAAAVAAILASRTGSDGYPEESGFTTAFLVLALAGMVGLVSCLLIPSGSGAAGQAERQAEPRAEQRVLAPVEEDIA
ncbi:MFS transporter [Streptomyces sp. NRRL S-340]|uniref:MFS transporter n=1 Tax=Streptomyces sp. NRRL S-340 TaxID=1463901 RepID=UPI000A65D116|nr:MFS transporter [Streptomyces sp. NRRL S-340]